MGFILTDIGGDELTAEDKEFIKHPSIAGIILFSRNYLNFVQLQTLTKTIKKTNPKLFIVADQEGGRVQRFRSQFTLLPSMREWSNRFKLDPSATQAAFESTLSSMVSELHHAHIDASLIPVLDVDHGVSEIIADRSFGKNVDLIKKLAGLMISTLHANGMPCTGKHFPGHGGVKVDSHKGLPIDERPLGELFETDISPYQYLASRLDAVMPAHVVYPAVDTLPVGFSKIWLQDILRKKVKFQGVIMSDDISMKAVQTFGDYPVRAKMALDAGCDLVSVCNNRSGAISVIDALGTYSDAASLYRLSKFTRAC